MSSRFLNRKALLVAVAFVVAAIAGRYGVGRWFRLDHAVSVLELKPAATLTRPGRETIRIATWNVAHGRGGAFGAGNWQRRSRKELVEHLAAVADHVRKADVDVLVLNEVDFSAAWSRHLDQAIFLAEELGLPYVVEQRNYDVAFPFVRFQFGNAVLSRHPVVRTELLDFPPLSASEDRWYGNHDGVLAELATSIGPLAVVAVHLEWRSEEIRVTCAEEIAGLRRRYDMPVIAAGDFNSTRIDLPDAHTTATGTNAVTYLLRRGGFQAFPEIRNDPSFYTFPSEKPVRAIDWILVTEELAWLEYEVFPSALSDHHLAVAELR